MPNFIIQKMENLLKSWNDLESSNNFASPSKEIQPPIPTLRSKNNLNQEVNRPTETPKTLPVQILSTSDANTSDNMTSFPLRYNGENNSPIKEQIFEMTSKTIKKTMITTTETIVTEENIVYDDESENNNETNLNLEYFKIAENETNKDQENNSLFKISNTCESLVSNKSTLSDYLNEIEKQKLETDCDKRNQFKKTPSIDSIKSKTIVTPIELEPNNLDEFNNISKELNIIKLETDTNIIQTTQSNRIDLVNSDMLDITQCNSLNNNTNSLTSRNSEENINIISNDLFDWLLWIDHTLESQLVNVGDNEEMQQAILKYSVIN
jgi:hypothetical protein